MKKKTEGRPEGPRTGPRLRTEDTSDKPVDYIRSRLRETEKIIQGLRDELGFYRDRHGEAAREKNELLKFVSERQMRASEQARLVSDYNVIETERDRLLESVTLLSAENKKLKKTCAELDAALRDERQKHMEAQEVIVYLEAQIEQLESMVGNHNQ